MMHCLRLLLSCESILRTGEPRVKFTGPDREFLMNVRLGKFPYEQLMETVEQKMKMLEELYQTSTIRYEVDRSAIDDLFTTLVSSDSNNKRELSTDYTD